MPSDQPQGARFLSRNPPPLLAPPLIKLKADRPPDASNRITATDGGEHSVPNRSGRVRIILQLVRRLHFPLQLPFCRGSGVTLDLSRNLQTLSKCLSLIHISEPTR